MSVRNAGAVVDRAWFARDSLEVAADVLGALLTHRTEAGSVTVRLTEVEAYRGMEDPGSHAFRGVTPRTAVMFAEPARLFVYLTYGMHTMLNIVSRPEGRAGAVLLRAGEIVDGHELVAHRRRGVVERDWARGPARLAAAMGVQLSQTGEDLMQSSSWHLELSEVAVPFRRTPRTGVSGAGGSPEYDWRFAATDAVGAELPSTLPYKRHPRSH